MLQAGKGLFPDTYEKTSEFFPLGALIAFIVSDGGILFSSQEEVKGVSTVVNGTITSTGKLKTLLHRLSLESSLAEDLVARLCDPDPTRRIVKDLEPRGENPLQCAWRHPYLWTDEEFAEIIHKIDQAKKGSESWPKEIYNLSKKVYYWKRLMKENWFKLYERLLIWDKTEGALIDTYKETYFDLCRFLRNMQEHPDGLEFHTITEFVYAFYSDFVLDLFKTFWKAMDLDHPGVCLDITKLTPGPKRTGGGKAKGKASGASMGGGRGAPMGGGRGNGRGSGASMRGGRGAPMGGGSGSGRGPLGPPPPYY